MHIIIVISFVSSLCLSPSHALVGATSTAKIATYVPVCKNNRGQPDRRACPSKENTRHSRPALA